MFDILSIDAFQERHCFMNGSIAEIFKDDIFKTFLFTSHFSGKRMNESSTVERHKAFDGQGKQIYG